jgi:hypothetical protein
MVTRLQNDVCNYMVMHDEMSRRMQMWFPMQLAQEHSSTVPNVLNILNRSSPCVRSCVIKTLLNGWTTSARAHEEPRLPCLFGHHDAPDALLHYASCEILWFKIHMALSMPRSNIYVRCGLISPAAATFKRLTISFVVHHAIKNSNTNTIINTTLLLQYDFSHVMYRWLCPDVASFTIWDIWQFLVRLEV